MLLLSVSVACPSRRRNTTAVSSQPQSQHSSGRAQTGVEAGCPCARALKSQARSYKTEEWARYSLGFLASSLVSTRSFRSTLHSFTHPPSFFSHTLLSEVKSCQIAPSSASASSTLPRPLVPNGPPLNLHTGAGDRRPHARLHQRLVGTCIFLPPET